MKQIVRAFSAGLFAAGIIFLIGFYFTDNNDTEYDTEEMIQLLEKNGYHILSEKEYISLSVGTSENKNNDENVDDADKNEETDKEEKAEEKEPEKEKDKKEHTYTLTIKSDMLAPDISELLEENNIIEDASDFTSYLEKHEYSVKIQLGSFKLSSDMDYYQIAETITNYARGQ